MRETEAVIHLIGIIAPTRTRTYSQAHVRTTRLLLETALQEGVPRFVHMSALGTRQGAVSRYHQTKWEAEELVRHSSLASTIFRPSIIYGPGDHFVNTLATVTKRLPWVPLPGSGRGRLQPVGVDEVAFCFERSLRERRSHDKTFDLGGPELLSLRQVLETIQEVLGKSRRLMRVPGCVLWPLALLCEWVIGKALNQPPPLTRDQLTMLEERNEADIGPAQEILGFAPRSFRAGISTYLHP
jgi:NADH dehydrogenase